MEWIEKLNEAITYMEEHLTDEIDYEQLGKLPAVPPIIFRECLPTWQVFLSLSTSAGEKCPLPLWICRIRMQRSLMWRRNTDISLPLLSTEPFSLFTG